MPHYLLFLLILSLLSGCFSTAYDSQSDLEAIKALAWQSGDEGSLPVRNARNGTIKLGPAGRFVGRLIWPLERGHYSYSSNFGRRYGSFHEGVDLGAATGTNVYAAHDAEVVYTGQGLNGYGKIVVLRQGPIMTVYGHNDRVIVSNHQVVKLGEKIAEVGSTGRATGPHLHFETRIITENKRYVAVNPEIFFKY